MSATEDRAIAYSRLGVTAKDAAAAPQITARLRMIHRRTKHPFLYYLRASDDLEARAFLELYDSFPKSLRSLLPVEAFCLAANVPPLTLLSVVKRACVSMQQLESTIVAVTEHPEIVENTAFIAKHGIDAATRLSAQSMIHKAVGFTPMPKTAQTTINVSQQQANIDSKSLAPPPELTIRRLQDRFNESRPALPAPAASASIIDAGPDSVDADADED